MKPPENCCLLGILDDGWAGLADSARQRLAAADVVIGAGRTLDLVRPHLAASAELKDMDGRLGQVPGWISAAMRRVSCRRIKSARIIRGSCASTPNSWG